MLIKHTGSYVPTKTLIKKGTDCTDVSFGSADCLYCDGVVYGAATGVWTDGTNTARNTFT